MEKLYVCMDCSYEFESSEDIENVRCPRCNCGDINEEED